MGSKGRFIYLFYLFAVASVERSLLRERERGDGLSSGRCGSEARSLDISRRICLVLYMPGEYKYINEGLLTTFPIKWLPHTVYKTTIY